MKSEDNSGGRLVVVPWPRDGERCNGAEESYLSDGCEALCLIVQKSGVVTEATNDGKEDGGQNADER